MKNTVVVFCVLALAGGLWGQQVYKPKPKISLPMVDFAVRNVTGPHHISCGDPFMVISAEVWNLGTADYNPARGVAQLYLDIYDAADSSRCVTFGWVPMDQKILKGHYQKFVISCMRDWIPDVPAECKENLNNATWIRVFLYADEGGIVPEKTSANNSGETPKILARCGIVPPVTTRRVPFIRRSFRALKRLKLKR